MILGLRPTNNDEKCSCKASLDYSHAVSCVASRKICAESRHDMVRDAVKRSLDQFNVNSTIEYRPLAFAPGGRRKRIRPDGKTPLLQALWDVCVTTPTCKSYLDKHSDTAGLVAASINETAKREKYDTVAAEEGTKFYPLVFESFGGFGKGARDFIYLAAESAVDVAGGGYLERSQILDYIRCSIAYALVNGNAALIRNAIRLAANHRPPPTSVVMERTDMRGLLGSSHYQY
jgi:hypothetical protein